MTSKPKVVLLGGRSQSHPMYTWCRGKQCVAMGTSFLMYCTSKPVGTLNKYDLNNILDIGNSIYQQVYANVQHELLSVDELPGFISKDDVRYRLELGLLRFGDIKITRSLTFQLANVFANYTNAFFVCGGMCLTLTYADGKYYLYDSHNRNKYGMQDGDGVACLITFSMFSSLCIHLQKLLGHVKVSQFELWPCSLQRQLKSTSVGTQLFCDMSIPIFHVQHAVLPTLHLKVPAQKPTDKSDVQGNNSEKKDGNVNVNLEKDQNETSSETLPKEKSDISKEYDKEKDKSTRKRNRNSSTSVLDNSDCEKDKRSKAKKKKKIERRTSRPRKCDVESFNYTDNSLLTKQTCPEKVNVNIPLTEKRKRSNEKDTCIMDMNMQKENVTLPETFQEMSTEKKKRKISTIELSEGFSEKIKSVKERFPAAETAIFSNAGELLSVDSETVSMSRESCNENVQTKRTVCKIFLRKMDTEWHIYQSKKKKVLADFPTKEKKKLRQVRETCNKLDVQHACISIVEKKWEIQYETGKTPCSKVHVHSTELSHESSNDSEIECKTAEEMTCSEMENVDIQLTENSNVQQENVNISVQGHEQVTLSDTEPVKDDNFSTSSDEYENHNPSRRPQTRKKKPLWKWTKRRKYVKLSPEKKKKESLKRSERRRKAMEKLNACTSASENDMSPKSDNQENVIENESDNVRQSLSDNLTSTLTENIPNQSDDNINVYSDAEENEKCQSELDIHEPDDLVDTFPDNSDSELTYTMSETLVSNSNYIYTSPVKIQLLNKGLENICRTCTKLCFPEQGRVIQDKTRQKYSEYIVHDENNENWFICSSCQSYFNRKTLPFICTKKGIPSPEIPNDLNITTDEERLLALRIPFMQIHLLPSGFQKQLKGNVINVPTDVTSTVDILPRYINDNGVVTVRLKRKLEYRSVYRTSNIRPAKVLRALEWLLINSSFYQQSNITINYDWLQETIAFIEREDILNDNGNISSEKEMDISNINVNSEQESVQDNSEKQPLSEKVPSNCDNDQESSQQENDNDSEKDNFSEIDIADEHVQFNSLIEREEDPLYCDIAPAEGRKPIHMFYDELAEEMCFPIMYAGQTIKELFPQKMPTLKRVRWQLTTADRRAAGNAEFIFLHYKKYQMTYVHDKVDFSVRCLKNEKQYTVHDVLDDLRCRNIARLDNGYFYFQHLRNSPQYLHERKRELLATVRQLGIPTFFISLSCADTHWTDLLQCIGKLIDKKEYSLQEIQKMSFIEKTRLINSDPVSTARYFDRRFHYFLREILYKFPYPLGKITNHFYRIEFQHRGSPHVHMLVYCEDCPRYRKNDRNEELIMYADKYISCSTNVPDNIQPYLMLQKHKHSRTCRKGGKSICRFGYPLPPFNETVILSRNPTGTVEHRKKYKEIQTYLDSDLVQETTTLQDLLDHFQITYTEYVSIVRSTLTNDRLFLQRRPYESRVNMYMKNLLHIWQANMDCQMCLNAHSVVEYIINYINKENKGLSLNLQKVAKECESKQCNTRETIKKLGNVFVNTTEVSVQECIYILLGLPLTYFSVDVIHVPTLETEKRTKVLKSKKLLEEQSLDSTDIYKEDKFLKYKSRPSYFDKWCMADYLTQIVISKRTIPSLSKEPLGFFVSKNGIKAFNTATHKYRISRQRVLSYISPTLQKERERYYRIQLLLFHPWKIEITQEILKQGTYEGYYLQLTLEEREVIVKNIARYNTEKISDIEALYKQLSRDVTNLVIATETDHQNANDIEEGTNCLTDGSFFHPTENVDEMATDNFASEHRISTDTVTSIVNKLWPSEKLHDNVLKLNHGQRQIFDHILKHVIMSNEPLRLFITGGAGTGKTLLLHSLYQCLSRHFNLQPNLNADMNSVLCLASTGKAAYLIKGNTIHTGLNIKARKRNRNVTRLGPDELNTLRCKLQYLQCVMIDEISLVGSKLFKQVDLRLQHVFGNYEPFGGKHVICFGDLYQLPPVRDSWIFESSYKGLEVFTENIWTEEFQIYELTETMRQKDGGNFADILNRMRLGNVTQNDLDILKSREIPVEESMEMVNVMHIFATNQGVRDFNALCFQGCPNEKYTVTSVDRTIEKLQPEQIEEAEGYLVNSTDTGGLERNLELAIGLLYDLTYNINVPDGLVNGASGYLRHVQFTETNDRPIALWLEFEEESIGLNQRTIYRRYKSTDTGNLWTPIFARTSDFQIVEMNLSVQRTQFPVKQSTGKTIHKSQGSTVPKVVVDLRGYTFRNGCYVACSRVRELDDLFLVKFNRNQIIVDPKIQEEMERLRQTRQLITSTFNSENDSSTFKIFYLNAQSLWQHFKVISKDTLLEKCNILLFNETHFTDKDDLTDFQMNNFHSISMDTTFSENGRRKYNGLCAYVQCNFACDIRHQYRERNCEYIINDIYTPYENVIVGLFYVTPNTGKADIQEMFISMANQTCPTEKIIFIGDLNVNCSSDPHFLQVIENITGLKDKIEQSTTRGNSQIDICLSNRNISLELYYVPWSYHFAVSCKTDF